MFMLLGWTYAFSPNACQMATIPGMRHAISMPDCLSIPRGTKRSASIMAFVSVDNVLSADTNAILIAVDNNNTYRGHSTVNRAPEMPFVPQHFKNKAQHNLIIHNDNDIHVQFKYWDTQRNGWWNVPDFYSFVFADQKYSDIKRPLHLNVDTKNGTFTPEPMHAANEIVVNPECVTSDGQLSAFVSPYTADITVTDICDAMRYFVTGRALSSQRMDMCIPTGWENTIDVAMLAKVIVGLVVVKADVAHVTNVHSLSISSTTSPVALFVVVSVIIALSSRIWDSISL
jgi:hypothetical protein